MRDGNRQWRISAGAAQKLGLAAHHVYDAIVHVALDRPVVNQPSRGDAMQATRCLLRIDANGFFTEVTAGCYNWAPQAIHEQMVQWSRRKHDAQVRGVWGHGASNRRINAFAAKHDRPFRASQELHFGGEELDTFTSLLNTIHHDCQWFFPAVLAIAQGLY